MQSQRDIREVLAILQREQEDRQNFLMTIECLVTRRQSVGPTATQLIGTATRGCVTLIDATGHQHPISVDFCTSFEVRSASENTAQKRILIRLSLAIQ
jgi:hypothetical protein